MSRRPEGFIYRRVVPAVLLRVDRDHAADESQLVATLQLGHRNLRVIHVDHGDSGEALWRGLAELGQPIVVGLENGGQKLAIRHLEQLKAKGGIENAHINTVLVHVLDLLFGDVTARPDVFKHIATGQLLRRFKPSSGLGSTKPEPGGNFHTVAVPPFPVVLHLSTRGPVPELFINPAYP